MRKLKPKLKAPDCVILDLDNTIYEYSPCHDAGMRAAQTYAHSELKISEKDFSQCFKQARLQVKNRLKETAASHNRLLYFQRLLELLGLGSQPRHALALEQAYWQNFLSTSQLFPEVEEFLDDLRIAGIPIVIITDLTATIQMKKFIYWDLGRFTDYMVTSEESGFEKPNPSIFELALAKIGGIDGEIWMIGDNYQKDIVGAKTAIMATTFLRNTGKVLSNSTHADYIFDSFGSLRNFLRYA
jgi:putative hydrolase of the HAD superfamily